MREIKDTLYRHMERLHAIPGCTAVAIGRKIVGGRSTSRQCITVFVERKLPARAAAAPVPVMLDGIPTDVVERRFALRHSATDPNARFDPLIGGISIGSAAALGGGTLGCFIRTDGMVAGIPAAAYALTNAHILSAAMAAVDPTVLQPFAHDPPQQAIGNYAAGQLGPDRDCAIATIVGRNFLNQVPNHPLRPGNRTLAAQTAVAAIGDRVYKYGATTRHTVGTVTNIAFANAPGQGPPVHNAIYIQGENGGLWCAGGDSGSVAIRYTDDRVVGLSFMADTQHVVEGGFSAGLAYDIQAQMNLFGNNVTLA